MELGGLVADFMFPINMWVFRINGPTHSSTLRQRKDEEQRLALAEMGYFCIDFEEWEVYDIQILDQKMRMLFGLANARQGDDQSYLLKGLIPDDEFDHTWVLINKNLLHIKEAVLRVG